MLYVSGVYKEEGRHVDNDGTKRRRGDGAERG